MKSNMKWDQLDFEQLKNENVWKILKASSGERKAEKSFFIGAGKSEGERPSSHPFVTIFKSAVTERGEEKKLWGFKGEEKKVLHHDFKLV